VLGLIPIRLPLLAMLILAAGPGVCAVHADLAQDDAPRDEAAPAKLSLLKLEDFLPHRLNVLSSLVSQALTRVYGRHGIGIPEWRVLVTLGENGVMTGKAVGAQTHMHKTKVSRAVAQLEQRKLVTRRANRADLREAFLTLTPAGRAVYEELAPSALEFMERLAEVVAPADRPAFDRALDEERFELVRFVFHQVAEEVLVALWLEVGQAI